MKNIKPYLLGILPLVCIVILLLTISCENPDNHATKGPHTLRKFNVKSSVNTESSAWFFLIAGGYSSRTVEETEVRMYYKNELGEYQFLSVQLNKVNIVTDNNTTPYIFITRNKIYSDCYNIEKVVIHCKEEDFVPEININDLK